jgi:hypothetical protein
MDFGSNARQHWKHECLNSDFMYRRTWRDYQAGRGKKGVVGWSKWRRGTQQQPFQRVQCSLAIPRAVTMESMRIAALLLLGFAACAAPAAGKPLGMLLPPGMPRSNIIRSPFQACRATALQQHGSGAHASARSVTPRHPPSTEAVGLCPRSFASGSAGLVSVPKPSFTCLFNAHGMCMRARVACAGGCTCTSAMFSPAVWVMLSGSTKLADLQTVRSTFIHVSSHPCSLYGHFRAHSFMVGPAHLHACNPQLQQPLRLLNRRPDARCTVPL